MQRHVPAVFRASWPIRTRRTVAVACTRRVLHYAPRAVFLSLVGRPRMLGLAGTDLKDSCSGMYKAGFSGVAPRAGLPEAYRKIGLCGRWRLFFFGPLYLEVTCSCFCFRSTGLLISGDDSRNGFSILHSSWFNSGYMFGISLRGFFGRISRFPT